MPISAAEKSLLANTANKGKMPLQEVVGEIKTKSRQ